MKVNIEHQEERVSKGWLRKTTVQKVYCRVEFSPEERKAIDKFKLHDLVVLERGVPDTEVYLEDRRGTVESAFNLTVKKLLKGRDDYQFQNPRDAQHYEDSLLERLEGLKGYIEESAGGIQQKSKTFEL